jgi:hypothetical protein
MKKFLLFLFVTGMFLGFIGCDDAAFVATKNLKTEADNFRIYRRVVFINGITDNYIMSVEGYCSIEDRGDKLEVTMKTGPNQFYIHYLGLADNVTYIVQQLDAVNVSEYHSKIMFRPTTIVPVVEADIGN